VEELSDDRVGQGAAGNGHLQQAHPAVRLDELADRPAVEDPQQAAGGHVQLLADLVGIHPQPEQMDHLVGGGPGVKGLFFLVVGRVLQRLFRRAGSHGDLLILGH